MTMVIAVKNGDSIIMTADKRITRTSIINGTSLSYSDDYKKIKIFDDKYIVSFAGRSFVAEQATIFIEQNIHKIKDIELPLFFCEAFNYGKSCFESTYPGVAATSTFFLGFIDAGIPTLLGFSSDDNYAPMKLDATIKANATSSEEEKNLQDETVTYISSKIRKHNNRFCSIKELADIYFQAIKRVDNVMIGKTAYTVILSSNGIQEIEHS